VLYTDRIVSMIKSRTFKNWIFLLCVIGSGVLAKQFCYKKTDGFALYKILSNLAFHSEWEARNKEDQSSSELLKILDQPFYYLAKGAQSYVFASADGKSVIKFFRIYHMSPPLWMKALTFPQVLQPFKVRKIISKQNELNKDFLSYKIAFDEMKEETGLLYLHLNKTSHLKKSLRIYDKIGIAYDLDLDKMEFLVQKKANLVFPAVDALIKTEGVEAAKEAICNLVKLLLTRCEKGIFDKDPDLNTNFGFLGRLPIQIDIGRFCHQTEQKTASAHQEEIMRITDNFRQWLDANHPTLSESLLTEIQNISLCPT